MIIYNPLFTFSLFLLIFIVHTIPYPYHIFFIYIFIAYNFCLQFQKIQNFKKMFFGHLVLSTLMLLIAIINFPNLVSSQAQDSFTSYFTGQATAMDIHYSSNTVYFANLNFQIVQYNEVPGSVLNTINTAHKSKITSLAVSPDGAKVLTGGSDFTSRVYYTSNASLACTFDELRGQIISTIISTNNNFYAFGSNQGYLYYGFISNCTKTIYRKLDSVFSGVQVIVSRNQIWFVDGDTQVVSLNYLTTSISSFTLPTSKSNSIFSISVTNQIGVCTSREFYVLDYTGIIKFTLKNPALYTRKCRFAFNRNSEANTYYLTAINQAKYYKLSGVSSSPLWNIWRVDVSLYKASLYLQQRNSGSRYGATSSILLDAGSLLVNKQNINTVSIAQGFNPFYNFYKDQGSNSCSNGFFSNSGSCQKCNWDLTRTFCTKCSSSGVCNQCLLYTYLQTNKSCMPCPSNCYSCSSSSICTSCVGGYVLVSSQCLLGNISGCVNNYWYSNAVSRCQECGIGFFAQNDLGCKSCGQVFANCSECDLGSCFRCAPNFVMMSLVSTNCEVCTHAIEGCAACLNQTYCDTCYQEYPYFSTPSVGSRICKRQCKIPCQTCNHFDYSKCQSCDSNRTLNGTNCDCLPQYPIIDFKSNLCRSCDDYLLNCLSCVNQTYCTACDVGFYFQDTNSTHQSCDICNYTCFTCNYTWYKCASCDPSANRILDSSGRCVCQSSSYFQFGSQLNCQFCPDHITNCNVCYNQSFCITCDIGYYVKSTGAGTNICASCQSPCLQCYGSASNCTDCASGRQLNYSTFSCDCLAGYYSTSPTTCASCSPILGSCLKCTNDSVCLQCWSNNFFVMDSGKKKCDLCQTTCLTCSIWTTVCATCDPLAKRTLNSVTKQCDCQIGYTQTNGKCFNCTETFQFCTSCSITTCYTCSPGYSLAFGGLKCVDCQTTYPGCIQCLNGVCVACNQTAGFQLSYSKCICQPGYYFKQLNCLPYKMGNYIQRLFEGYANFSQDASTSLIKIQIYFRCEGLKIPYGIQNSVKISINAEQINSFQFFQDNTTITLSFLPPFEQSFAAVSVQFKNRTIYDLDQYGPKQRFFNFTKNIFISSNYELSEGFSNFYTQKMITPLRWISSILVLLGMADFLLSVIFTIHILPAFLLLNLSPPIPLQNLLLHMSKINDKSLFVFTDLDVGYQNYGDTVKYIQTFGSIGGLVNKKVLDLVFLGCILVFYGIVCPRLTQYLPEGKIKALWFQKFELKKYSILSNSMMLLLPSYLFTSVLDIRMQQFNPTSYATISLSLIAIAFTCIFAFVHPIVLYSTQFNDNYKNEDCYFGSSILEPKSVFYVLSLLVLLLWSIPMIGILGDLYCLPFLIVWCLWHISYYRFWDNFPNKFLYFTKLFYSLVFLFFCICFLMFTLSEKYTKIDIKTIQLLGLISLVCVLILLSLSLLQALILIIYNFYKSCRQSVNLVDNIQEERNQEDQVQEQDQKQETYQKMRASVSERQKQQQFFNSRLTNKQEHMKQFKQKHLKTSTQKMYAKPAIATQSGFNATSHSNQTVYKKRK